MAVTLLAWLPPTPDWWGLSFADVLAVALILVSLSPLLLLGLWLLFSPPRDCIRDTPAPAPPLPRHVPAQPPEQAAAALVAAAGAAAERAARERRRRVDETEALLNYLHKQLGADGRRATVFGALKALIKSASASAARRDPRTGSAARGTDQGLVAAVLRVGETGERVLLRLGFSRKGHQEQGWALPPGCRLDPIAAQAVLRREQMLTAALEWRKQQRTKMRELNDWMRGLTPDQRRDKAEVLLAAHTKKWTALLGSAPEPVHAVDVPWPGDVLSALQYVSDPRTALRELQRFYHPDKFVQQVGSRVTPQEDLQGLLRRITMVSQDLNAMRDTFRPPCLSPTSPESAPEEGPASPGGGS
eukprot:TRINITY_DN24863_c0_g1_i2.p1 TRINITY_DN24863_c0_g1~~TRINITY_DN24863_c0_g1_i2.p1  ORF type:complete len:381 (+),score=152.26 TRINITY_DN24863_c0_g1_i2:67-1143(+)